MLNDFTNLPDPSAQPEFYRDVAIKRFFAWVIDAVIIVGLTLLVVLFTAFTALLVLGIVSLVISLLYRWVTVASFGGTPGMRLMSIELRDRNGMRPGSVAAFWHAALFLTFKGFIIPQLISIAMMLTSERGQALHDGLTGIVAINRAAER